MKINPLVREIVEERIPFNKLLGLKLDSVDHGHAAMRFDFQEQLIGNFVERTLHGGVIATVLDTVGGIAVLSTQNLEEQRRGMGTVDMRVDFLRPGRGKYFVGRAEVIRPGRILVSTRMELVNDEDTLIAIGQAIYRVSTSDNAKPMNV